MITLYGVQKIENGAYLGFNIVDNQKLYSFENYDDIAVFYLFIELSDAVARSGEDPKNIKIIELVPKDA